MRTFMDRFRKNCSDYFNLAVIAAVILCFIIMKDPGTTAAVCWLAVVFSVSFFMRPLIPLRTLSFYDEGFAVRFGAGLSIAFYFAWTASALGMCDFSTPVAYVSLMVLAAAGVFIKTRVYHEPYVTKAELRRFLSGFATFAVIFLAFFWIIGFNPATDPGTENYMDFGFMQAIYRQKSAFVQDIWFAGERLNYYFFGQAISVFMCRLAGTTPEFGYNMMLSTFIGMVAVMVYEIVSAASKKLLSDRPQSGLCSHLAGILGGVAAAFCGNPHYLFYGVFARLLQSIFGTGAGRNYWIADGTVYIHTDLGDPDNGKTEFPAYSVILGDLHAHVINLIFVLPLIALLFDMCFSDDDEKDRGIKINQLLIISMLLGYYKGSNYWDFAIYYVITGAVVVFTMISRHGFTPKALIRIAVSAAFVTVVSIVLILPFTMNFTKMESGIGLCEHHTPLVKLAVLWLIPVSVTVGLTVFLYSKKGRMIVTDNICRNGLCAFMLCAIGLVMTPEFIYVLDIYGEANQRFNTMFKLTYQAFVLFAIVTGIAFAMLLYMSLCKTLATPFVLFLTGCFMVLTALCASYTPYCVHRWFGNIFDASARWGISSLEPLRYDPTYAFEMEAYDVIMQDDRRIINIIESCGSSYTHDSSLSVYTGSCTPAGWFVHEWMWHNDSEPIKERSDEVFYFYSLADEQYCRNILRKYDIDYILTGPAEVCKYAVAREGYEDLGTKILSDTWMDCELSLIKVDKNSL